jgi:hypothetical protein
MVMMTTLLTCVLVFLVVLVITLERRMRLFETHRYHYSAQTIVPCAAVILSSKWYTLFLIPPSFTQPGLASLSFSATGTAIETTDVCVTLHGTGGAPLTLYDGVGLTSFALDGTVAFGIDCTHRGTVLAMCMETSNPGQHVHMSDLIATLTIE